MTATYELYLTTPKSLTFEQMLELHNEMMEEMGTDLDVLEIYGDLLETAVRYAHFRAQWLSLDAEKKADIDSDRTSSHNSIITKLNMISRYLKMQGKNAAWRDILGYEEDDPYNRKRIGDFACFLVFVNSVNAR